MKLHEEKCLSFRVALRLSVAVKESRPSGPLRYFRKAV